MKINRSSMLNWYPKIKDLDIPQPKTWMYPFNKEELEAYYSLEGDGIQLPRIKKLISENHKPPFFLRTDQTSAKHQWEDTCYVVDIDKLDSHFFELTSFSRLAGIFGIGCNAMIVRELIPMNTLFTAFHRWMPVNPEIRFFVKDGKVLCSHWYWIKDAIVQGTKKENLPENWESILDNIKMNIDPADLVLMRNHGETVSKIIEGYWSVDFCQAKTGKWYLIDMASGYASWHPICKEKIVSGKCIL